MYQRTIIRTEEEGAHAARAVVPALGRRRGRSGVTLAELLIIMAGGDLMISGNPVGQFICRDQPNPAGSDNIVTLNEISGNPTIIDDCNGRMSGIRRVTTWAQPAS